MTIQGLEGMNVNDLNFEVQQGGKFVIFEYCISVIILTFKRASDVYFIKAGENTFRKSIGFTVLSLVAGWWGFPWGPIYTIAAVVTNLRGGKDVTPQIMAAMNKQ